MLKRKLSLHRRGVRQNPSVRIGYADGYNSGYNRGFNEGVDHGYQVTVDSAGMQTFEGVSIIIPTYNKKEYIEQCIESIARYTPEAHEIIVVDNGSTDGTSDYLASQNGKIRFRLNNKNHGFAGAVNQGLAMARGSYLLVLNNDTLVTPRWLSQLLTCLESSPRIGIVGPVTNYISGDQLIQVPYTHAEDMLPFAESYNHSRPEAWVRTSRMTGFCILMKRELFRGLGFFDEGFRIGNCEDDDYGLRVRLLGYELVIAKDTFIHHFGSVSMKELGTDFDQVYQDNLDYYSLKWGEPASLYDLASSFTVQSALNTVQLYPTHVIVRSAGGQEYWIESGRKHPLTASVQLALTRVSKVDLAQWEEGEPLPPDEVIRRLCALSQAYDEHGRRPEGCIAMAANGRKYQHSGGSWRLIASEGAMQAWRLEQQPVFDMTEEEWTGMVQSFPIIAPPRLENEFI